MTQEVGNRGLVLMYEIGDEKSKKELLRLLMGALQVGKAGVKKSEESEVFPEG